MKFLIATVVLIVVLGTVQAIPTPEFDVVDQEDINTDQDDTDLEPSQYFRDQMKELSILADQQETEEESNEIQYDKEDLSEAIEQELEADETEEEADKIEVEAEETEVEAEETEVEEDETEVEEEEDQNKVEIEKKETEVEIQSRKRVQHGSTIALQTYELPQWLSCARNPCRRSSCPKTVFSSQDYRRCVGEVFRIVRQKKSGIVRSGDVVALHYPHGKQWLGCPGRRCGKSSCPGTYNNKYGFETECRWESCAGEVFRIYKRGERDGAIIEEGDKVAFYYVNGRLWLSQGTSYTQKRNCLGTRLPPSLNQYDNCAYETFTIDMR